MARRPYRAMTGFENEFFLIDNMGRIAHGADILLNEAQRRGQGAVKKEVARNFIEIASDPNEKVPYSMENLISDIEWLRESAKRYGMHLLPLGTYPGSFMPSMRDDGHYGVMRYVFGKKFPIWGRCCGFHSHFTLPRGIFDSQLRVIKILAHMKVKDALVNSHNLLVASDPVFATFMQSSPYYEGRQMGKDSRIIMFRGGRALRNQKGIFSEYEELGCLPPYKPTVFDLMDIISSRYELWKRAVSKVGINIRVLPKYWSLMDTTWTAVKINPNGTLEERGMDINHPQYIAAIGLMMKFVMRRIQDEVYTVVPSEIGITEPFRVEGDVIYIPPYSYVENTLQYLSAYEGLENGIVHEYCRRFLRFAKSAIPNDRQVFLRPLERMLAERKTVSDEILDFAARKGYAKGERIPNSLAAQIALLHARRLEREILDMKRLLERYRQ